MTTRFRTLLRLIPDRIYIQMQYFYHFHRFANLKNPRLFNEKLQWLKLHDRNPLYTTLVDKYTVKKWVADKIGEQYIIPTLAVWEKAEDIDFDKLPNQFVLKCNHSGGGNVVICRDKTQLDKQAAIKKLTSQLQNNNYWYGREWPYKNVVPRIIAEAFMSDGQHTDLTDYKFFCFNGVPLYCQVISDRSTGEKIDFFDMEWNLQEFTGLHRPHYPHYPHYPYKIEKPICFEDMKQACGMLAEGIPFVRVDFYEIKGKVYFGEMTFYPAGGFGEFAPDEWNYTFGEKLMLPHK